MTGSARCPSFNSLGPQYSASPPGLRCASPAIELGGTAETAGALTGQVMSDIDHHPTLPPSPLSREFEWARHVYARPAAYQREMCGERFRDNAVALCRDGWLTYGLIFSGQRAGIFLRLGKEGTMMQRLRVFVLLAA